MSLDLLIIGGGPAGLTAGLYAARGGLKALLLEQGAPGGQAATTDIIENYPGFPEGISGPELMQRFEKQARRFGLEMAWEEVRLAELAGEGKKVITDKGEYMTRAVLVATGAQPRLLGVPGEMELRGRGVSYCATCDGAFFRGKKVAVVGGGDAAVEEGIFLTRFAREVVLIHRRDVLRATKVLQDRARDNPGFSFRLNTVVEEIQGREKVEGLRLKDAKSGVTREEEMDGVFVFAGTMPNTSFLAGHLSLDEQGYIITNQELGTSLPGVYAAGDVRSGSVRQVAAAVGDGAQAALSLERFLAGV